MIPTIDQMRNAVWQAGSLIRQGTSARFFTQTKPDQSLVTTIDTAANEQLRVWSERFSVDFIGEEGNGAMIGHDHIIYVDPLDGTSTFVAGKAEVAVVMTLMQRSGTHWVPIATVLHEPLTYRTWWAEADFGTSFQHGSGEFFRKLPRLPTETGLAHVSVVTWRGVPHSLGMVRNVIETYDDYCHHGSGNTSINGGLIASGSMHASIFGGMSAVETVAMQLLVQGVGGVATNLWGKPLSGYELVEDTAGKLDFLLPDGAILASNQPLVNSLTAIIQRLQ